MTENQCNIILLLRKQNEKLTAERNCLKKDNLALKKELDSYKIKQKRTHKTWFELELGRKNEIREKIKNIVSKHNVNLSDYAVFIKEVTLCDSEVNLDKSVVLKEYGCYLGGPERVFKIFKVLYIKDRFLISDEKYIIIRVEWSSSLPSFTELRELRWRLNKEFSINLLSNKKAAFTDIHSTILKTAEIVASRSEIEKVIVKISADGTKIGRDLFIINFTISLVNDVMQVRSAFGQKTIGIAEIKEDYDQLKEIFAYIMEKIKTLKSFKYKGKIIDFDYIFAADLKLMAIVLGVTDATSNNPIPFCECDKDNLHKLGCSIFKSGRTKENCQKNLGKKENKGYKKESLLTEITYIKCVPCTLHKRMRIFLLLCKLFIDELIKLDGYYSRNHETFWRREDTNLKRWFVFLNDTCGIHVEPSTYNATNKAGFCRDFSGDECIVIMENMKIKKLSALFPDLNKNFEYRNENESYNMVEYLWEKFFEIDRKISSNEYTPVLLQEETSKWLHVFLKAYQPKHVTPYIHILCNHMHEFLELYGNLALYSQQGLEKLNDFSTREYFMATNRHNNYLEQMLARRLRIEMWEHQNHNENLQNLYDDDDLIEAMNQERATLNFEDEAEN